MRWKILVNGRYFQKSGEVFLKTFNSKIESYSPYLLHDLSLFKMFPLKQKSPLGAFPFLCPHGDSNSSFSLERAAS